MSLNFPVSMVGKRGGESQNILFNGMLDVWEPEGSGVAPTGKHNGTVATGTWPPTVTGPWGADTAWDGNWTTDRLADVSGSINEDMTLAIVVSSSTGEWHIAGVGPIFADDSGPRLHANGDFTHIPSPIPTSGFHSVVIAYNSIGQSQIWIDGVLHDTRIGDHNVGDLKTALAGAERVLRHGAPNTACLWIADRAWTQDDVDLFHNGGSFLRYEDL
jgi:hypothetical protein